MEALRVLVVEDEALIHGVLQDPLESAGYSVQFAIDGEEALHALEAPDAAFAALVTDVRLGDGASGWDVARRARELNPSMPVVYITGDSGVDWASNGVPNSILVTKPFALAQVITAISQLLNMDSPPAA
jgi:two-component system cell cycle response regulator CpdR